VASRRECLGSIGRFETPSCVKVSQKELLEKIDWLLKPRPWSEEEMGLMEKLG
jgi:hypothetical protein